MRILKISLLLLLPFFAYSQIDLTQLKLDHNLNNHPQKRYNIQNRLLDDTLHVYAAMVQFKEDNNNNTTGNGRFDLSNNYPDSVDAPPHDSSYFADHLEFLKNYYLKSSKGKLNIVFHLIGGVRNLPNEMSYYSPTKTDNSNLGKLFFDTWKSVDSVYDFSGISSDNSAFIIFHAGVGRDIDLTSQGFFVGQLDIPSVYLGVNSLRAIYGDTLQGYYSNEGVIINNSSILPEQEWRIINTSFGDIYLELGLNGIVVASIGSHLGLPDLFNTQLGITAIGRFGLMDGQSIFSYLGVFPPEPSPWEKQYLGWISPTPLYNNGIYNSVAASLDFTGNKSVYKAFISAKEYFLVENRNRDAYLNGQTMYFVHNGVKDSIKFTKDEEGFNAVSIWKLKGNIVDVDELDWSLPGLKNDTANYQGGILIWHIDENVIDSKIASNTINNDINHRGVDVEEAKGAQQIGVKFNTPFGEFIGDGTIVDYWFNGDHLVPSNIYKNEFTPTSIPNSKSYFNVDSRICIRNFSEIAPTMSFTYEICSSIMNISGFPRFVGFDTLNANPIGIDYNNNGTDELFINIGDSLYGFMDDGNPIRKYTNGFLELNAAEYIPALFIAPDSRRFLVSTNDNSLNFISLSFDSVGIPVVQRIPFGEEFTSPVITFQDSILAGTFSGKILKYVFSSNTFEFDSVSTAPVTQLSQNRTYTRPGVKFVVRASNGDLIEVTDDNKLLLNGNEIAGSYDIQNIYTSPALADLNNDGVYDIIFAGDNKLYAINRFGVVLDNFPYTAENSSAITAGVAVADINNDGTKDVIFGTSDGKIYAYSANGTILSGFPLLTGKKVIGTPAIANIQGNYGILAYSSDGYLYGWKTSWEYNQASVAWKNYLQDAFHINGTSSITTPTQFTGDCLPKDKVYNWPNPVHGSTTNIRYFLNGSANSVKIKILDLSGELVTTLTGSANSGFENEVVWNVSNVQSGIYIGVVELEGGSCSNVVSFKIAVIK